MELVDNFKELGGVKEKLKFRHLFNEGEICIKSSDNKIYTRLYKYVNFGVCEIYDRLLPITYTEEMIDKKKLIKCELQ